jgi:hypothetical protein
MGFMKGVPCVKCVRNNTKVGFMHSTASDCVEIETDQVSLSLRCDGSVAQLKVLKARCECCVPFRSDNKRGPLWDGVRMSAVCDAPELRFEGIRDGIRHIIAYAVDDQKLRVTASLMNESASPYSPEHARLTLGVDTEMIDYPAWNDIYFPTLLRAEPTHFWGYFMTPKGRILSIASPDPVASWAYDFQPGEHRILTVNLDPLHGLPLPARHPQTMTTLAPGEMLSWRFIIEAVERLEDVKQRISCNAGVPMLECSRYTVAEDEAIELTVFSEKDVEVSVRCPDDHTEVLNVTRIDPHDLRSAYKPNRGVGPYQITATDETGKTSQAIVYVRQPWSWYLKQARQEAIRIPQKATTHCESWLGHFSNYLAKQYFPDAVLDAKAEHNFRTILPLMVDVANAEPTVLPWRIQNVYYMISLLVDVYQADGEIADLQLAADLADWLIKNHQSDSGAYVSGHGVHYTCVCYGAKSMMELAIAERSLAFDASWRERSERHFLSAKRAVDDLAVQLDDIGTEGQSTYEDGMISCSATQLAMMALLTDDQEDRKRYQAAAEYMLMGHRCLDQMLIPDARMREGSLRFWEAQYDVMLPDPNVSSEKRISNMMNSPHGWTAWRIPGFWYMYQLTGNEGWLQRAMESLGACVQLIDGETGTLRWAFVQDPYIDADVLIQDPADPDNPAGMRVHRILGEQYVDMISHFYHPPLDEVTGGHWGVGGSCDNDVHEIFKALEEVALTAAYVVERDSGEVVGYNCRVFAAQETLKITPAEDIVTRVHLNLKRACRIECVFNGISHSMLANTGMQWISEDGILDELCM